MHVEHGDRRPALPERDLGAHRVHELPDHVPRFRRGASENAEDVLEQDHEQPDRSDRPRRQPHQSREQDHAPAEHPDDAGEDELRVVDAERPRRANHGELEEHEQESARHQVPRQRARAFPRAREAQLQPVEER